tara:strand:+ start:190 stop:444 length:255 start_codon:yes stop_codon:yes gene_type:complete
MRGSGGFEDFASSAPASVRETALFEFLNGVFVQSQSVALANHWTIPVQTDASKIAKLEIIKFWSDSAIKIFESPQKLCLTRTCK